MSWRPWEQELFSTDDYTTNNGNPYRDLALTVRYWRKRAGASSCGNPVSGGDSFSGYGFWEGIQRPPGATSGWQTNIRRFLIRTAFPFPDGTWCWKTACARSLPNSAFSSTAECSGDSGLNRSGQVVVTKAATPVRLYATGLPKVAADKRSLVYGDGATQLLWLGDTAWDAPIKYGDGTQWAAFVTDRTAPSKDFRTILVAPATQTVQNVPAQGFRGFVYARTDCSNAEQAVVPNRCTTWDARYWAQFDEMILKANSTRKGLIVVVAGVMDPLVRGGDNNSLNVRFPALAEATVFARNLAARLAGHFVIFSPSYDAKTVPESGANLTVDGVSVTNLVKAVGAVIKSAAPRHLIGVHLAGSNPLGAYLDFQTEPWLSLQVFQSGHGGSNAGAPCNIAGSDATSAYRRSVCRAREGALEFRCIREAPGSSTPLAVCTNGNGADRIGTPRPAVNVEGEYESAYVKVVQPNGTTLLVRNLDELAPSRARSRHTGWVTALSGSFGNQVGLYTDVVGWTNPAAHSNNYSEGGRLNLFQSDDDLGRMNLLLGQAPFSQFTPVHTLVCGNFPATVSPDPCGPNTPVRPEELKRHIGATDKVVLVHVPGVSAETSGQPVVKIRNTGLLATLSCGNWSWMWVDPRNGNLPRETSAKCAPVAGGLQFTVPPPTQAPPLSCPPGQSPCDWVLKLQAKTVASANAPNANGALSSAGTLTGSKVDLYSNDLKVWTEVDEDSQGTSVWAQLLDPAGEPVGDSFLVHPLEPRLRSLPTATRDANGNFLVVWEQDGDDATDDVMAIQISNAGVLLGEPLRVNPTTESQHGDPAVTSDGGGGSYITWTEYPLDGSLGNIWLQVFLPSGQPDGDVLMVTGDPGNQSASQVQADGSDGAVVAWTSDPPPSDSSSLKTRPSRGQGIYFRKLRSDGKAQGPQHAVLGNGKGRDRLIDLKVKPNGRIKVAWQTVNDSGEIEGSYEQDFDSDGNPESGPKRMGDGQ